MSLRRMVPLVLAMLLGTALISATPSAALVAAADAAGSDSAVTVSGTGDFANLKVTVSQTKNLINQTVRVSWTGGAPTLPDTGDEFDANFLQIMQCWGDDPAGPDRTQCQFGATGVRNTDNIAPTRQVISTDPEEILKPPPPFTTVNVPFWAVGTPKPTSASVQAGNDYFDSQVTNEIPLAKTHGDGAGEEFFEVETVRQAAGLGCGDPITTGGVTEGRSCWLVIVPRGTKDADGVFVPSGRQYLSSSPLSQSNWDHRIVIPLEFQPVGQPCPIGAPERPVIGAELVVDAVSSWQPALCAGGGPLFNYIQLPDEVARGQLAGRLALVTDPVPPDQVPPGQSLVYAPVGLSGLAIAFNIDHQPGRNAPAADRRLSGVRFTSMKLTPRLVAKLLTQSYRQSVLAKGAPFPAYLKNNPDGLLTDPEFLALNQEYQGFVDHDRTVPQPLVQLDGADVTAVLWSWVKADPDASAFLAGRPDSYGMVINPNNKDLVLPTSVFPRNDQSCDDSPVGDPLLPFLFCTLDAFPYAKDMRDAGRSASRGDPLTRAVNTTPPSTVKGARQFAGHVALLAVVDAATASRYDLPTAQLLNAAGHYVAPTAGSLLAAEAAMKPSAVAGVLAADPATPDPAAYPLTALSYAVTSPATLDPAGRKDYAAFLRYAAGRGQQEGLDPGQLPPGMVPLPGTLTAQTLAAAAAIEAQTAPAPGSPAPPTSGPARVPTQPLAHSDTPPAARNATTHNPVSAPPAVSTPAAPGVPAPVNAPEVPQLPVAGVRRTPPLPAPAVGALLLVVLIGGAVAATYSPVTRLLSGRLRRRRKEVMPTEQ